MERGKLFVDMSWGRVYAPGKFTKSGNRRDSLRSGDQHPAITNENLRLLGVYTGRGKAAEAYRKLWGVVMLAKCSNPSCSASFLSLQYGRLYRLDRDPKTQPSTQHVEYYWLCERCAPTMTLQLEDDGGVTVVPVPPGRPNARVNFMERKRGLLLRSVNSRFPGDGVGVRRPGIDIRDVA